MTENDANASLGTLLPLDAALQKIVPGVRQPSNSRITLAFKDRQLEDTFLLRQHRELRPWILGGVGLVLVMLVALSPLDLVYVPSEAFRQFRALRFFVFFPLIAVALAGIAVIKSPVVRIRWTASIACMSGLCMGAMTRVAGPPGVEYMTAFTFQALLFVYFMVGLPFRWSVGVAATMYASVIVAVYLVHPERGPFWFSVSTIAVTSSVIAIAAYRAEWTTRQNFLTNLQLETEYSQRLAAEQDRSKWLESIAGFLRHELKNAITGIGSSLGLAEQSAPAAGTMTYLQRAKRSLDYMRRFLQQAAEATSLDAALRSQEPEILSLSDVVSDRVQDYRRDFLGKDFLVAVEPDVRVSANADALVQMLDKLVNNAVEHSNPTHPIEISVRGTDSLALLSIRDYGDALPADRDKMFEPFVGSKPRHGRDNLGLGLYVARVIARHHGGAIRAEPLVDPAGADLVVELPRAMGL
jgi:signal transduction histidine kinase